MESGFRVGVARPVGEVAEGLDVEDVEEEEDAVEEDVGDVVSVLSSDCNSLLSYSRHRWLSILDGVIP